jgi:hypothetical protein
MRAKHEDTYKGLNLRARIRLQAFGASKLGMCIDLQTVCIMHDTSLHH